jgi:ankyrin repeat protein
MPRPTALVLALIAVVATSTAAAASRPPVIEAAKNGSRAELRALIQKKVDVNAAEGDGTTALHWASYRDDLESADLLLRAGAKANAANDLGATPLWTASLNGSLAMVKRLLQAGADPGRALIAGETPVMVASRGGYPDVVEALLANGANPNAHGARGQTALMWAVAQKHPEVVQVLLARGADVHARSDVWSQMMAVPPHGLPQYNRMIPHGGDTPLLFAALSGDLASAKLLVAAGAGVNDTDAWGVTSLVLAAHSGFEDLLDFLLERGADANAAAAGFSALHGAVMRRSTRMVASLVGHGADPNARLRTWTPTRRSSKDFNFDPALVGATPFWLASRFADPPVMRLLLKAGADPLFVHRVEYHTGEGADLRNEATTTLMAAAGMGGGAGWVVPPRSGREALVLETTKLLVDLKVDLNAANTDGRTALDAARAAKLESVVTFLVEKGAQPGAKK